MKKRLYKVQLEHYPPNRTTPLYEMEIILCRNLIRENPHSGTSNKR